MSTNNTIKGNNQLVTIIKSFEYRLPMFLITIHCSVMQYVFSQLLSSQDNYMTDWFKIYYYLMISFCGIWCFWHATRASSNITCKLRIGFIVCETIITVILFITVTNFFNLNIPFSTILHINEYTSMYIYGTSVALIYVVNAIETHYCKNTLQTYHDIEEEDDMKTNDNVYQQM